MQSLNTGSIQKLLFPAVCEAPVFGCFLFHADLQCGTHLRDGRCRGDHFFVRICSVGLT